MDISINEQIKPILVSKKITIKEAIGVINKAGAQKAPVGLVLAVDKKNRLQGIVTDGDIRRAIDRNEDIVKTKIEKIMIKDPVTLPAGLSHREMFHTVLMEVKKRGRIRDYKVDKLIITNQKSQVVDVMNFFEILMAKEVKHKTIAVIGMGYVGLTLALKLADVGYDVVGIERNPDVLKMLKKGHAHFHEVGINSLLKYNLTKEEGVFELVEQIGDRPADVYVISVGTPLDKNKKPNPEFVINSAEQIAKVLKKGDLVVLRSTVPVGTTRKIVLPILERETDLKCGKDFYLAFCPERTIEGKALEELRALPQIIGGFDKNSHEMAANLFRNLTSSIVSVDSIESAELVKLIDNSYRDLKFAYANEIALFCDKIGINAVNTIKAANRGYERNSIPVPSPGVGGACLSKDPHILNFISKHLGHEIKLAGFSRRVNEYIPKHVVNKAFSFLKVHKKDVAKAKIFVMGFAFKGHPETSDTRDSPTLDILKLLKEQNNNIYGYDPVIPGKDLVQYGVTPVSLAQGFKGADCALILINHDSFSNLDLYPLLKSMKKPSLFFDGWQFFSKQEVSKIKGVTYEGMGVEK